MLPEMPLLVAGDELRLDVPEGGLTHASAKRIPHQKPFIRDSFAFEVAAPCIGDGFLRPGHLIRSSILGLGSLAGFSNHRFVLVAELCRYFAVSCKHLFSG